MQYPAENLSLEHRLIGEIVKEFPETSGIAGVIRGLLRDGTEVWKGMKLGDVDPRGIKAHCHTISGKARTISAGVLRAVLEHFNG